MANPQTMSVAEFRKQNPEYDHSGDVTEMTAAEYATGKRAWDRPLVGRELTDEVHGFMPRVIAAFTENGYLVYHTYDPRKCREGFYDLRIVGHELSIVAELKVGKNKPDTEQRRWLDEEARTWNRLVFLWYPEDWECIKKVARGILIPDDEPSRWVNRRK